MMRLHGYWRAGAPYRVRIALNLKGLEWDYVPVSLLAGEQRDETYRALNPQGLVPALEADGRIYTQSLAIMEWLEETHPAPALLPADAEGRAVVRAMAGVVACDIHPLNNVRVLQALKTDLGAAQPAVDDWVRRWIADGFSALDAMIARHGGQFAYGDAPTMADCCLIPQVYSAERFKLDLGPYPHIARVAAHARALDEFARAAPEAQPDAA